MPVTARRQLYDLPDDMASRVDIQFYQDSRDALLKSLAELCVLAEKLISEPMGYQRKGITDIVPIYF